MNDTSPEVEQLHRKMVMERSGEERLMMGALMFDVAREIILTSLPKHLTAPERKQMLFERIYGIPLPKDFGKGLDASTDSHPVA